MVYVCIYIFFLLVGVLVVGCSFSIESVFSGNCIDLQISGYD